MPVEGGTGRAVVSPAASTLREEMAVSGQRLLAVSGQILILMAATTPLLVGDPVALAGLRSSRRCRGGVPARYPDMIVSAAVPSRQGVVSWIER